MAKPPAVVVEQGKSHRRVDGESQAVENSTLGPEVRVVDQPGEPGEVDDPDEVQVSEAQQRALLKLKRGRLGRAMRTGQLAQYFSNTDIEKMLDSIPTLSEGAFETLVLSWS